MKKTITTMMLIFLFARLSAIPVEVKIRLETKEVQVGDIPKNTDQDDIGRLMRDVDPADFLNVAEMRKYSWIMPGTPVQSPDKKRMGYVATRNDNTYAVIDGIEQKPYYDIGTPPIFSPNSKRVAYAATRDNKWVIVVDGVEGAEYDQITQNPMFSSDGRQIAYAARRNGSGYAVLNGIEQRKYNSVRWLVFSPDGKRLAYWARKDNGKQVIVIDGVEGKEHERIIHHIFSPDGQRVAYVVIRDGKRIIAVDGIEGKEKCDIIREIVFSQDGKYVAYEGVRDELHFVGLTGEVYNIKRGDKMVSIMQEKVQGVGGYDWVYGITFSPDGERLAFIATRDGKSFAIVDGVEQNEYEQIGPPAFSSDSKNIAYAAKREDKCSLVVNGIEGAEFDSPLSNFIVPMYPVRPINNAQIQIYTAPGVIIFDPRNPNKFYTVVRKDKGIFHIEAEIVEE